MLQSPSPTGLRHPPEQPQPRKERRLAEQRTYWSWGNFYTNLRHDIRSQCGQRPWIWPEEWLPGLGGRSQSSGPLSPPRPSSGCSSPRRRSRRCPRCGTRFQEWKSACSLWQGPSGVRTARASAALHTRLRCSVRPRSFTRHFEGPGIRDGKAVGRRLGRRGPSILGTVVHRAGGGCQDPEPKAETALITTRSPGRDPVHSGNCSLSVVCAAGVGGRTSSPGGAVVPVSAKLVTGAAW